MTSADFWAQVGRLVSAVLIALSITAPASAQESSEPVASPALAQNETAAVESAQFMSAYETRVRALLASRGVEWTAPRFEGVAIEQLRVAIADATIRFAVPSALESVARCLECRNVAAQLRMLPDLRSRNRLERFGRAALVARDGRVRERAPSAWWRRLHASLAGLVTAALDDNISAEDAAQRIALPLEIALGPQGEGRAASEVAQVLSGTEAAPSPLPDLPAIVPVYITADTIDRGHLYANLARVRACEVLPAYLALALEPTPAAVPVGRDELTPYGYRALDILVRTFLPSYLDAIGIYDSAERLRSLPEIDDPRSAQTAARFFERGEIRDEFDRGDWTYGELSAAFREIDPISNLMQPVALWSRPSSARATLEAAIENRLAEMASVIMVVTQNPEADVPAIVAAYERLLRAP